MGGANPTRTQLVAGGATGVPSAGVDGGRGGTACAATGWGAGPNALGAEVAGDPDRADAVPAVAAAGLRQGVLARSQRPRAVAVRALRRRRRDGCNAGGNAFGGGHAGPALPAPDAA